MKLFQNDKIVPKEQIIPKNKLFKMNEIVTICLNCKTTTRRKYKDVEARVA